MKKHTPFALLAAVTAGLASALIAGPAMAAVDPETPTDPPVEAPAQAETKITSLVDDAIYSTPISSVSGTGEPGADLTVWVDVYELGESERASEKRHDITIGSDGTWSVPVEPAITRGDVSIDAYTSFDSEWADVAVLQATGVATVTPGSKILVADAPSSITGTADPYLAQIEEHVMTATLTNGASGTEYPVTVAEDGSWTVDFGQKLELGNYTLIVDHTFQSSWMQEANHLDSTIVGFSIVEPAPANTGGNGDSDAGNVGAGDGGAGGAGGATDDAGDAGDDPAPQLAATGMDDIVPFVVIASALLVAGGAALLIARRKRLAAQD